ncbi:MULTISPECIES: SAV_6107 family HEPN domain-containing protein [unclassified Gordonia (in: high G+C Gram-positive bacteria)]
MARRAQSATAVNPIVVGRARDLLSRADLLLDNAIAVTDDAERFRQLYLAALRAAGAAIAIGESSRRSTRGLPTNAWSRLAIVMPELDFYADFFAARSSLRMNIEAGIERTVNADVGAETHRRVLEFLDAVETLVMAYERGGRPSAEPSLAHPA